MRPLSHSRTRTIALLALAAVAVGACGRSKASAPVATAAPAAVSATSETASAPTAAPAGAAATIGAKLAPSPLGDILVSDKGLTLYAFTNDIDAKSACTNKCAEAWPPVIVPANWDVGPGLDNGIFATTTRDDGQLQLVAGKFPLYTFAGDAAPGDVNGQGSGDVWFVVDTKGLIVKGKAPAAVAGGYAAAPTTAGAAAPAPTTAPAAKAAVAVAETDLGSLLVDADGRTLYGFTKDSAGTPTCEKACADAWPPIIVPTAQLPAGLDAKVFSVVPRPDGRHQLKAGKWPLYAFAGDAARGDVNGQGSGGVWFVVKPDGGLIKS